MDINSKFSKANDGVLAAPTELSGDKPVLIDNVGIVDPTGWPTDTPIHFALYKLDTDNTLDPASLTFWKAILIGSTLTDMQITGGVNQPYTNGDICVIQPTAGWANDLVEGIKVHANDDGTLKDSAIPANSVDTAQLKAAAVTTAKINDGAVTLPKITQLPKFAVSKTSAQTVGTGAFARVNFNVEEFDTHNVFDSNMFTVPAEFDNTYWQLSATVTLSQNDTGRSFVTIYKNGSEIRRGTGVLSGSSGVVSLNISTIVKANTDDYFEVYVFSSGSQPIATDAAWTWFTGSLLP